MICKIIKKKGAKGSGGGRDAFAPGIRYGCEKAEQVRLINLSCRSWHDAAEEMRLTSELNMRVQKPYYHVVLSWPEHEQPSQDQMFEAMEHLLRKLGLDGHQIVMATHSDTSNRHIHAVVNTVNPITGKNWSKSNDHRKAELACREIELKQSWSHDRGRFDFEVTGKDKSQEIRLKRNPEVWGEKRKARTGHRQKPSASDIIFEKRHGFASFGQDIPRALFDRVTKLMGTAGTWNELHAGLAEIGLAYEKYGSGARMRIIGSDEHTKASRFGQNSSLGKLQKRLGRYEDRCDTLQDRPENPSPTLKATLSISESTSHEEDAAARSTAFKLTLLRRMYTGLFLDDHVARQIRFVHLHEVPPRVAFVDGTLVTDQGRRITTTRATSATIAAMIAIAKAKGWTDVAPSGRPTFVRDISVAAARAGLRVSGVPPDIQQQSDAILAQVQSRGKHQAPLSMTGASKHIPAGADQENTAPEHSPCAGPRTTIGFPQQSSVPLASTDAAPRTPLPSPAPDMKRKHKSDADGRKARRRQVDHCPETTLDDTAPVCTTPDTQPEDTRNPPPVSPSPDNTVGPDY